MNNSNFDKYEWWQYLLMALFVAAAFWIMTHLIVYYFVYALTEIVLFIIKLFRG